VTIKYLRSWRTVRDEGIRFVSPDGVARVAVSVTKVDKAISKEALNEMLKTNALDSVWSQEGKSRIEKSEFMDFKGQDARFVYVVSEDSTSVMFFTAKNNKTVSVYFQTLGSSEEIRDQRMKAYMPLFTTMVKDLQFN